jgi:hypothetical protein
MADPQLGIKTRITKVERHDDNGHSYYTANVTIEGVTREYHDRHGSWMTDRLPKDDWPKSVAMREALRPVAEALSIRVYGKDWWPKKMRHKKTNGEEKR